MYLSNPNNIFILSCTAAIIFVGIIANFPDRVEEPYVYSFNNPGILEETSHPEQSPSRYWWLNSGGILIIENGEGKTNHGDLPQLSFWRVLYSKTDSIDTDGGKKPQNIFRLLTRGEWQHARIESDFKVNTFNKTDSPNRNESNGILLMARYQDDDNLYYGGLRIDGKAVIKKKLHGEYVTLALEPFSALPKDEWFTISFETINTSSGSVRLKLFINNNLIAEAIDISEPIISPGNVGIRTDFMDTSFKNFKIETLEILE